VSTGPELAFLYLFGLLDAVEHDYTNYVLVGELVDMRIGLLDSAESEPTEFFVKELHMLPGCWRYAAWLLPAACVRMRANACECVRMRANAHLLSTACDGVRACV
jgi:hypothetical protein